MSESNLSKNQNYIFPISLQRIDESHMQYETDGSWYKEHLLLRVVKGTLFLKIEQDEYLLKAGDIVFICKGLYHSIKPTDALYELIFFSPDEILSRDNVCHHWLEKIRNNQIVFRVDSTVYRHSGGSEIASPHYIANRIFNCLAMKKEGYEFIVQGLIIELFGQILLNGYYTVNAKGIEFSENKQLKNIFTYIEQNYDKPITLQELSQVAYMSPNYFCRFFKKNAAMSPIEYLTQYRIKQASKKLLATDDSVLDIAIGCGFNSVSYFIRIFQKQTGLTPKQYRKEKLGETEEEKEQENH